ANAEVEQSEEPTALREANLRNLHRGKRRGGGRGGRCHTEEPCEAERWRRTLRRREFSVYAVIATGREVVVREPLEAAPVGRDSIEFARTDKGPRGSERRGRAQGECVTSRREEDAPVREPARH